jgi:hypothetical protein
MIRDNVHLNQLIIRILSFKAILVHGKGNVKEMLASLNRRYGIWKARFWLLVKRLFQSGRFPHLRSLAGWRNLLEDLNLDRVKFDTRICSTECLPVRLMPRHS